ncbi:MAG TPA: hypothetical protein VHC95_00025 [Opitutales bacterium]|nr:hypothetical protein [Opitutales bacterium]
MNAPVSERRTFLKNTAVLGAAAALSRAGKLSAAAEAATAPAPAAPPPTIGIQINVSALAQPDYEKTLDDMKARAGVNALFPFIYTYVNRTTGLPARNFRGGNFAMPHMEFYQDTTLTFADMRAPDLGDLDILARTIPAAKSRGIKTFAWVLEDNEHVPLPSWDSLYEIDFHGRRTSRHPSGPCYNNPAYRGYLLGLMEDYARSYDIDGVMWSSERQGGLFNALGAYHNGQGADPGQATCFCEFCLARAKKNGVDPERARAGFGEIEKFVRAGRARTPAAPRDGWFVQFFRILLNYPELLAWEKMWIDSRADVMAAIYQKVKSVKPALQVGWHIWHALSFSPFHRAELDYAPMAKYSDYIKPVLYANCAGDRMRSFTNSVGANVFGDVPRDELLDVFYKMLGLDEAPYAQISAKGFSSDYVRRETRRCLDDAGPNVQVWPGIDVDVPVPPGASQRTPEGVKNDVLAAFHGGATGVILSRNYAEMDPNNLAGAGAALKELGLH